MVVVLVLMRLLNAESPGWQNDGFTSRGIPIEGQTLVGASVIGDPSNLETRLGASLGLHRSYYSSSQQALAISTARADLSVGRLPWISFKAPSGWDEMANGAGDDWATDLADALSDLDGPVWIAINHEPEGDGNVADWRRMQQRLSPIFRAADNVAYTIVLAGWQQLRGQDLVSDMEPFWPGREFVDVIGFDVYNWYATTNPNTGVVSYDWQELVDYYQPILAWLKASDNDDLAWALAETGYTDAAADMTMNGTAPDGATVSQAGPGAEWLSRGYNDMNRLGGVALSYFDVPPSVNNEPADWTWPIIRSPKTEVFSRTARQAATITD